MKAPIVLPLPSGTGNPRNSEGSFINLKDGRIMFAYTRYNGVDWGDHESADIVAHYSSDNGHTWTKQHRVIVPNEGQCNVMSVSLLRLKDGRIALFYMKKNSLFDCRMRMRTSEDEGETWSDPVLGNPTEGYLVTNNDRVIQLASGRIICPSALHICEQPVGDEDVKFNQHGIALFSVSDDGGKTWRETKERLKIPTEIESGLQEPGLIQRSDGSLYGWARTSAGQQWEFTSSDEGETWTTPKPSRFRSPQSPLSIKAIAPSQWLAVWNDQITPAQKETTFAHDTSWGRTPLAIATSTDEGATWSEPTLIEDDPHRGFCYTAIHPTRDAVLLAYCCGGRGTAVLQDLCVRQLFRDKWNLHSG